MKLIFSILITIVLAVAAMAQEKNVIGIDRGLPVSGAETASAVSNSGVFEGNTFMFTANDRLDNYALAVSLDYVANPEPNSYETVGGNWTLSVFRKGVLIGTIYGDVGSGTISEVVDENSVIVERSVAVQFRTQGGTGEFEGTEAQAEAEGSLKFVTEPESPKITGVLYNVR